MNYYLAVLKKYATFSGRAGRKEFWLFTLFQLIIMGVLIALSGGRSGSIFYMLYIIYTLATLIPSLAVLVRRLHDTNRSGWWYFISFVPVVGGIVLLVFLIIESDKGENRFGPGQKIA